MPVRDGFEIAGSTTVRNRQINAPIGHNFYDTDLRRLYVMSPAGWEIAGGEDEQSSSSSSASSSSSSSSQS